MSTIQKLADFCDSQFDLENAELGKPYYYQSLPLCVIDAVYSISANYTSTMNVVDRYCRKFDLQKYRNDKHELPPKTDQQSIDDFLSKLSDYSYEELAEDVFDNRQRTSPKSGILKAEAVVKFAEVLRNYDGNYLQDRNKFVANMDFKNDIKKIPGHGSGISIRYFFMLAGSDDHVKPDRMINRFIKKQTGKDLSVQESQKLIVDACNLLQDKYPHLSPRLLGHQIWNYQSGRR